MQCSAVLNQLCSWTCSRRTSSSFFTLITWQSQIQLFRPSSHAATTQQKVSPAVRSWLTHLEGEAEGELTPRVSLLSHLKHLSLKATPLQLIQLVVTLDHTEKSTGTITEGTLGPILFFGSALLLNSCTTFCFLITGSSIYYILFFYNEA